MSSFIKQNILKISIASAILFFVLKRNKKPAKKMDNYIQKLTAFIKNKEGGLSKDENDPAAKFPAPVPQKYHTNKGVTYRTFIDSSKVLKFNPSIDNFLKMPDNIWQDIFIKKYYNKAKFTSNEILNGFIAYWYWQGWNPKFLPVNDVVKVLQSNKSDRDKLSDLVTLRRAYYQNIANKNPKLKTFLKGWNNTAADYFNTFSPYL